MSPPFPSNSCEVLNCPNPWAWIVTVTHLGESRRLCELCRSLLQRGIVPAFVPRVGAVSEHR